MNGLLAPTRPSVSRQSSYQTVGERPDSALTQYTDAVEDPASSSLTLPLILQEEASGAHPSQSAVTEATSQVHPAPFAAQEATLRVHPPAVAEPQNDSSIRPIATVQPQESSSGLPSARSQRASEASSAAPDMPEFVYDSTTTQRDGHALVFEHPTQVNFVPTSEIQTAVSINADRIVIDTILPPTAALKANYAAYRSETGAAPRISGAGGLGVEEYDPVELLKRHEEEVYRTLAYKLTPNYDPTGTIKGDIFETVTGVTRFPDPKGTNRKMTERGKCPCICCEVGCKEPMKPHRHPESKKMVEMAAIAAPKSLPEPKELPPAPAAAPLAPSAATNTDSQRPLHSFLDMRETKTFKSGLLRRMSSDRSRGDAESVGSSKSRFGFLTLGRFGRSRSSVNVAQDPTPPQDAAVAVPGYATQEAQQPESSRRTSFSDLTRRRRNKHMKTMSASSALPASRLTASMDISRDPYRPSLDANPLRAPAPLASSSQADLSTKALPALPPSTSAPIPGRFSLDSSRPEISSFSPQTPTRRSSKLYAIIYRNPAPSASHTATSGQDGNNGEYVIGKIVEEEEGEAAIAQLQRANAAQQQQQQESVSRRQSALMSSYEPKVGDELDKSVPEYPTSGSRSSGQRMSLNSLWSSERQPQVGLAI